MRTLNQNCGQTLQTFLTKQNYERAFLNFCRILQWLRNATTVKWQVRSCTITANVHEILSSEGDPPKKNTHPNKNSLHKQFAQTLSVCFLLILKGKGWKCVFRFFFANCVLFGCFFFVLFRVVIPVMILRRFMAVVVSSAFRKSLTRSFDILWLRF